MNIHRKSRRLSLRDSQKAALSATRRDSRDSAPSRAAEDVELILPSLHKTRQVYQNVPAEAVPLIKATSVITKSRQ
jgi:hypothetical protein